ncbi:MAG: hypothetical protein R3E44_06630 [Paracoccaceae bacterium]
MPSARLALHLPEAVLSGGQPLARYYARMRDGMDALGIAVDLRLHDRLTLRAEVEGDGDFHIVDHGTERHPRILNTGVAYVFPFWSLDPWGIRANSSIASMPFRRTEVDGPEANRFFRQLKRRLVDARASRGPQPEDMTDIPEGAIAVFLQSEADRMVGETAYLRRKEMVEALLARDDPAPIVIKRHPRDLRTTTRRWLNSVARKNGRVSITDANIHDILARARVTVTINSAVGIESMLHRVPVVLCGASDFHHAAVTVQSAAALDDAIQAATDRRWPHVRFLYWYFRLNCMDAGSPTLAQDVLARIAATGFDVETFG